MARQNVMLLLASVAMPIALAHADTVITVDTNDTNDTNDTSDTNDSVTTDEVSVQRDGSPLFRRTAKATRRKGPINIDGAADEEAWSTAPEIRYSWQESPNEGGASPGPTFFRVLYDDEALYVALRAVDPEPEKIGAVLHPPLLFRKVQQSDWFAVMIDPQLDRRLVYGFSVNAAGVRMPFRAFTGGDFDPTYSPVWEVQTRRTPEGWSAEMRIPHSQTRVSGGYQHAWGFQVLRRVARTNERDYWSPFTFRSGQDVKGYGTLVIDDKIDIGRTTELRPYVRFGARLQRVLPGDTTRSGTDLQYGAGLDLNVQALKSTKITATVNPDFGQVEADPSEVNLTAYETFFSERRPFFIQDTDLFKFGLGSNNETMFYTRRIGARPQLSQAGSAAFVNEDETSPIYGAVKVTSDIGAGAHLAGLSVVTGKAESTAQLADGTRSVRTIEPLTAFNVAELTDTFRGGSSELRAIVTSTNRALDDADIDVLARSANTGGISYLHQFDSDRWAVSGMVAGSSVRGPANAIALAQQSSRRFFQRPDGHETFDPTRTHLEGLAFQGKLQRLSGFLTGNVGVEGRTPGFEINDIGFQQTADIINPYATLAYLDSTIESGPLREKGATLLVQSVADFNPEILRHRATLSGHLTFRGNSNLDGSIAYTHGVLDTALLRGGPAIHGEDAITGSLAYTSDQSKDLAAGVSGSVETDPDSHSKSGTLSTSLRWNVRPNLELLVEPGLRRNIDNRQFLSAFADVDGNSHYVMGKLRQWEARTTMRVEYTMTPNMSLSFYGELFASAGRFDQLLEVANPRAASYDARFRGVSASSAMGSLDIDLDGDGLPDTSIPQPDFSVTSLLTNMVFRWEYKPGSFVHVIWTQARKGYRSEGSFTADDARDVFTNRGAHVVLAKLSYWWGR